MANKVEDFLAKLAQRVPKAPGEMSSVKNRVLEKVYLNYPANLGRYQILPMDSILTDFPFVTLFGTREVCIPRRNMGADGKENVYNAWIRLLPKSGYQMKDATGRVVCSLTAEEEQLLYQAYNLFDMLFEETGAKENMNILQNLVRKRNYTIFHGYCLNRWSLNDSRTPVKQNFSALFVCTAKSFMNAVDDNIKDRNIMNNGDASWIPLVYNRNLSGRDGFLMFNITPNKSGQAGFSVTVSHETGRAKSMEGIEIPEEDAELMVDPVESLLGWQANKDNTNPPGQKRLFNAALIKETINFMSQQLAAVRMSKANGMDIMEAIKNTNEEALRNQVPTNTKGVTTNDAMLASLSGSVYQTGGMDSSRITENNTQPFQTPPAAHIDPVTSAPMNNGGGSNGSAPFNPSFGSSFGQPFTPNFGNTGEGSEKKDDLPF